MQQSKNPGNEVFPDLVKMHTIIIQRNFSLSLCLTVKELNI